MAVWRKVIVSGSSANLTTLQVDNLALNQVVIGGGQGTNLSTTTTLSGMTISGSFSGSFFGSATGSFSGAFSGDGSKITGVVAAPAYALTFGEGIGINAQGSSSYTGNQAVTITVSGASSLNDNIHVKWNNTDNKFTNSNIFDDGTNIQITGSNVVISGSTAFLRVTGSVNSTGGFTGSLFGTASYVTGSIFTGANQVTSASYALTASFATTASTVTSLANALSFAGGVSGSVASFNGSAAVNFSVGKGALITVADDYVQVSTSSLTTNQIPKYSADALAGSNISDTGTQVQIAAGASSGLSVAAGGVTVTGNSTFNNNVSVIGDLAVAGTASFQNTQNLLIGDRFAALASGSTSLTDGGIIVVSSTTAQGMSGSALYLEGTSTGIYGRFAVAPNVHVTASAGVTPDEYMVTVKIATSTDPSQATPPTWGSSTAGSGNMWINDTAGTIWIYA